MMSALRHLAWLLAAALCPAGVTSANALCVVNSVTSVTPISASTGTYTFPTAPVAQQVTFTAVVNYSALLGDECRIALSFGRSTLPASMLLSGGGATLPYTVTSNASGGSTLLYISGGAPAAGNRVEAAFVAPLLAIGATTNLSLTAYFLMQPGSPQRAGSYAEAGLSADVFRINTSTLVLTLLRSVAFAVSGTVAKVCTIGGVATPASDTAAIPITATGSVNTTPINRSYANAACNTPSNLQLTSQSGAVVRAGAPPSGFTNLINYSASAGFSGATATLDTATTATATGPESGTAVSTSGATPSGNLSLTIVPKVNTQPLISGSYSDTLRITITPQ
jgi:hypothetical protein